MHTFENRSHVTLVEPISIFVVESVLPSNGTITSRAYRLSLDVGFTKSQCHDHIEDALPLIHGDHWISLNVKMLAG